MDATVIRYQNGCPAIIVGTYQSNPSRPIPKMDAIVIRYQKDAPPCSRYYNKSVNREAPAAGAMPKFSAT